MTAGSKRGGWPAALDRFIARVRAVRAELVLALLFAGFLALALLVRSAAVAETDRAITVGLQRLRSPPLDAVAVFLTRLGSAGAGPHSSASPRCWACRWIWR
jgi:hypothetical protein